MSVRIINAGSVTEHIDVVSHTGVRDTATIVPGGRITLPPGYALVEVDYARPHLTISGSPIPDDNSSN